MCLFKQNDKYANFKMPLKLAFVVLNTAFSYSYEVQTN